MLKVYVIIVFTLTITLTTNAAKEEDTENRAQNTYHVLDGTPHTYYFGYDSKEAKDAPRLMREETRLSDGTVTGRYGYTDPFGVFRVVKYVSGNNGYYATEEIGEQVTSSTPQYYKATAPQVEGVSEEPINYSIELATKFNPPLYHPEAHTMSPDETPYEEQPEEDGEEQPYSGLDINNRNHQIFSLSNSEDILEKKYRERKQLERTSRGYQTQNPINVVVRQSVSKRVGLVSTPYEMVISDNKDNKRINHLNNENRVNYKPIIRQNNNNNNNNFLRRAPVENQSPNESEPRIDHSLELKEQNNEYLTQNENKTNKSEEINDSMTANTELPVTTAPAVEKKAKIVSSEEDSLPDNIRHLYYRPTRSPSVSYSTSISKLIEENNESENKTETIVEEGKEADMWTRIRRLFRGGSSSTTEGAETTTTEIPIITDPIELVVPQNERRRVFFTPVLIESNQKVSRPVPGEIEEDINSKYMNGETNYREPLIITEPDHTEAPHQLSERTTISMPTESNFSETRVENYGNNSRNLSVLARLPSFFNENQDDTTTRVPSNEFEIDKSDLFREIPRISSKLNLKEQQNQSSDITKSAFFHEFLLSYDNTQESKASIVESSTTPYPSNDNQYFQTTPDFSFQKSEQNNTSTENIDTTTESAVNPTNEKFLEHFWNNYNEQSVLFSEAKLSNETRAQNDSKPVMDDTIEWISEQFERKSLMFSEGKPDNKSEEISIEPIPTTFVPLMNAKIVEIISETTPTTTETTTTGVETKDTTTTTPEMTTTESINREFLDTFWHNFNDNSDEYLEIGLDLENKTSNVSEQRTPYSQTNETTAEMPLNITLEANMTETENTLNVNEKQDLDQMEDNNRSMSTTSPDAKSPAFESRFLPTVEPPDESHYIPPLSAIFDFPHMRRKRVRRVKTLRNLQNTTPGEEPTTTSKPEEVDIMSTDATEELMDISGSDDYSSHLKTIASQRVYRYVPPYPVLKENYFEDESKSDEYIIRKPIPYSDPFDDMSEIMTSIQSMSKTKKHQTEDRSDTTDSSEKVKFDDKPDSFLPRMTHSNENIQIQKRYLLPLEPQTGDSFIRESPKVVKISRNINRAVHRYEPIIRLEV